VPGDAVVLASQAAGLALGDRLPTEAAICSYLKVVAPGWPMLLSSLKSLVETGEPLEFGR